MNNYVFLSSLILTFEISTINCSLIDNVLGDPETTQLYMTNIQKKAHGNFHWTDGTIPVTLLSGVCKINHFDGADGKKHLKTGENWLRFEVMPEIVKKPIFLEPQAADRDGEVLCCQLETERPCYTASMMEDPTKKHILQPLMWSKAADGFFLGDLITLHYINNSFYCVQSVTLR